jgi:hypothetical protein
VGYVYGNDCFFFGIAFLQQTDSLIGLAWLENPVEELSDHIGLKIFFRTTMSILLSDLGYMLLPRLTIAPQNDDVLRIIVRAEQPTRYLDHTSMLGKSASVPGPPERLVRS